MAHSPWLIQHGMIVGNPMYWLSRTVSERLTGVEALRRFLL